jgi:hypothetical protein
MSPPGPTARQNSTLVFYAAVTQALERERNRKRISMDTVSELAGIAERSYAKAIHPQTASGRYASWEKIERIVAVLFPDGFDLTISPGSTRPEVTPGTKKLIHNAVAEATEREKRLAARRSERMEAAA